MVVSSTDYISQACDRLFDKKFVNAKCIDKRPKWYDSKCRMLRNLAASSGERIENESDRIQCLDTCKNYRSYKQLKRRSYYHECLDKIEIAYKNDRSSLWNLLSKFNPNISQVTPCKEDMFMYYLNHSKPKSNEQFDYTYEEHACKFLANKSDTKHLSDDDLKLYILNRNFTEDEILSCIKSLKNKKSPGIDSIPGEFIKCNAEYMVSDITLLFNYFIERREFPESWAEGLRNAIYKTGSRLDPKNYRGITVLSVFEKLFEAAIHKRLEFIDEAFLLNDRNNSGFKKGSRTVDNISILQGIIERHLILGQNVIVCFVDFSRAFDMINRNILFYKLNKFGLRGRVIDTLQNLYEKTYFRIKHNGLYSKKIHESIGVNQGGNASPILFKKYLQDLSDYINNYTGACIDKEIVNQVLWADDLILISTKPSDAQLQLNGLSKFCSPNQMVVNNI